MKDMSFTDLVKSRFSVRKYKPIRVEKEKLLRCIESSRLAPSASNSQPWKFIIVDDPGLVVKVAGETYSSLVPFNKFVIQAPVIDVIVLEKPKLITQMGSKLKNREWSLIDIGIAAEHFCLQAAEEGLGTCMLGWFNEKPIQKILNIPSGKTIGLLISLGYPDYDTIPVKKRKSTVEVLNFNTY